MISRYFRRFYNFIFKLSRSWDFKFCWYFFNFFLLRVIVFFVWVLVLEIGFSIYGLRVKSLGMSFRVNLERIVFLIF